MESAKECMFCDAPNSACDMVQCDTCELWAHYSCAGVTEAVKDHDWNCRNCTKELQVPKAKKPSSKKTGSQRSKSDGGSVQKSNMSLEVIPKNLEIEQRAKERQLEEEMILQERKIELERALKEKRRQKEKELRGKQLPQEREMKQRQLKEERKMYEEQLAEEAAFLEERRKMRDEFQKAKQNVVRQYSKENEAFGDARKDKKAVPFDKNVEFWWNKQGESSKPATRKSSSAGEKSSKAAANLETLACV
ncbi:GRB10-interacting GYF protein 2-like [Sabethes cyaneus]|uniref:GRB10-interacting GYF protein 2-like n=1 Tax=Sabethes cyaneus TaxID=53552 RepID=UPI00237E987C|nr:GRB10-interacting GYF protein 2-like [Sabethes cyaneus]